MVRLASGLTVALIVSAAFAGAAFAHATLLGSEPEAGEVLKRSPKVFVLTFDEPIEASSGRGRHRTPDRQRWPVPLRRARGARGRPPVGSVSAFVETAYGRLVLAKVALLVGFVALGACSWRPSRRPRSGAGPRITLGLAADAPACAVAPGHRGAGEGASGRQRATGTGSSIPHTR